MLVEAIYHQADTPYAVQVERHHLKLRLRTKRNDVVDCLILHGDRYLDQDRDEINTMKKVARDELFDYYETTIFSKTRRIRYLFLLKDKEGEEVWLGERGTGSFREQVGLFHFPFLAENDLFEVPKWASDAIIYQLLPDRFYNGDLRNDPENKLDWGESPTLDSFFGGDLVGVIEKLPYLESLGVNAIYMTPIFKSPTNHKYDTWDYLMIDPHFGDIETVRLLIKEAHKKGIRVIFDVVFNHSGTGFFAFQDILENGEASAYKDWFFINNYPIYVPELGQTVPYETFNNIPTMPKLNTKNPEVIQYLLEVVRFWTEDLGIDGWRMDVANEVDHEFWRDVRRLLKSINPEVLLIGEAWHEAGSWLRGDQFDGITNYKFREVIYDYIAMPSISSRMFEARVLKNLILYPDQANISMFNLIDSHDTERLLNTCKRWNSWEKENYAEERFKLGIFIQFIMPGIPMIYYGNEIGMDGGFDPDCRRTMIWDESQWNLAIHQHYKDLIHLRKSSEVLKKGGLHYWFEDQARNIVGFIREYKGEVLYIMINNSSSKQTVEVKFPYVNDGDEIKNCFSGERKRVNGSLVIDIPKYGYVLLEESK
ncbi:alpha-glycosidase [Bacillus sp. A116_S68]|jgi:glycosidase|nr:alpha-glycosidase [Bacillus sp. A116_S68]